jgi:UDP-GlcNAc:undecaprenyl-phosphate GlcNAc-1-phosphate transferase
MSAAVAGAAFGFLPYNFYPARVFMGDSGSMLLGLMLGAATISGVGRTFQPTGGDISAFSIPVLIPVIVLAVPLTDVALSVFRRLRRGRPVFAPDKEHLHHQLREIGHTHRRAVLVVYFWSALAATCALAITYINGRAAISAIIGVAVMLIASTFVPQRIRAWARARKSRRLEAQGAAPATAHKSP